MSRMIEKPEYVGDMIMGQSRHQFVYGYKGEERAQFLKALAGRYPVTLAQSSPMGIYICNTGLPEWPKDSEVLDEIAISSFYAQYTDHLIVASIIDTIIEQIGVKDLDKRGLEALSRIGKLFSKEKKPFSSFASLAEALNDSVNVYSQEFAKYLDGSNPYASGGEPADFYDELPISISYMVETLIGYIKSALKNSSYFGIIFDEQNASALGMHQAINGYIGMRINGDLSIKTVCEPGAWKTFYTQSGTLIEACHDYGIVDLDGSHDDYTKTLVNRF